MVEKEIIGDCTLYRADCMDVIGDIGKVDAVITDPPYGTQNLCNGYGRRQLYSGTGKVGRTILNDNDLSAFSGLIKNISFDDFWLIAFHASSKTPDFIEAIGELEYKGGLIWDKRQMGLGYTIRYSHECIAILKKGDPPKVNYPIDSVLDFHQKEKRHPHQKPVKLMKKLIDWVKGVIFDPFMGSGTTGVACAEMRRKFIGIELDAQYFDIACKRIENAYKQRDLFL